MYETWKSYLIITKNKADISMMTLDNESIATRYWMNTPHMNGGYKYAVGVIFANGFAAQDMASHSTRGARPAFWHKSFIRKDNHKKAEACIYR